ncbi:hypothetical protein BDU57DRAFT_533337 [Ampelomyces quisqualis]|uniref:Uncharacterized protein n=1 Tax=Ampelomyces quisqualis TaxID=50730 RepID=A0A6A5Q855_AMPQU|nr:hypothetical protein BDU57DRAFT_533337 [Ampelomyces quisqualis]
MGLSSIPAHLFYNCAVFYIGANNEHNIDTVQAWSSEYDGKFANSNAPNSGSVAPAYAMIDGSWMKIYDIYIFSYGTLSLAVTEYRLEIDNDTSTGWPQYWPSVSTDNTNAWSQNQVD